jgi:uncharacterized protein
MEQRLNLVTLGVTDVARARAFYARLGWRESDRDNASIAFFQLNGFVLALYGRTALAADARLADAGPGFGGITLAYNVRERDEVEAVLAAAQAAGGCIVKPAQTAVWGGYSGYFTDPDGHPWEVAWNPGFSILPDGTLRLPD